VPRKGVPFLVIASAAIAAQCAPVVAADACTSQIPAGLKSALEKTHPDYRVPRETDNLAEDVANNREHGGKGCLGYASADFNGDGVADALIGLSAKAGDAAIVVAAIAAGPTWTLHELKRWKEGRRRLYVDTGKPDRYDRTKSGPSKSGELDTLVCPYPVAIFGATESSAVAYCLKSGVWQHVWIAD